MDMPWTCLGYAAPSERAPNGPPPVPPIDPRESTFCVVRAEGCPAASTYWVEPRHRLAHLFGMAIPPYLRPLAESAGMTRATAERTLRALRTAGAWLPAKHGRGQTPTEVPDLANMARLLLGLPSPEPSDAPDLVPQFWACAYRQRSARPAPPIGPPLAASVGDAMQRMIQRAATGHTADLPDYVVCSAPFAWNSSGSTAPTASASTSTPRVETPCLPTAIQRSATIQLPLIEVAGRIWRETQKRRTPGPIPRSKGKPRNENGANPCQGRAIP